MRKSLKMTLITMIIAIVICMLNVTIVKAASSSITGSKTVTVGESVTINASVNAGAWNVVLSGNGQTKELVGQTATQGNSSASTSITFTPNKAETYTFTLSGDITDYETEKTDSINKTCTITVKEKKLLVEVLIQIQVLGLILEQGLTQVLVQIKDQVETLVQIQGQIITQVLEIHQMHQVLQV